MTRKVVFALHKREANMGEEELKEKLQQQKPRRKQDNINNMHILSEEDSKDFSRLRFLFMLT